MESTTIAAWWGAITASFILGWDIYKWFKDRATLQVNITRDFKSEGRDVKWLRLEIINSGSKATNVQELYYKKPQRDDKKKAWFNSVKEAPIRIFFPFMLRPGHCEYVYIAEREIRELNSPEIYIKHTMSNKPIKIKTKG